MVVIVVMVVLFVLFFRNQINARGTVDHIQIGELPRHIIQKGFHARAVDEQRLGLGQGAHIAGEQLVIVQAAGAGGRHGGKRNALHPVQHVFRQHIHGIEGSHDGYILGRGPAAGQGKQQQGQQQGTCFFHKIIFPFIQPFSFSADPFSEWPAW